VEGGGERIEVNRGRKKEETKTRGGECTLNKDRL
jgi:hypothetical protein